MGVANPSIGVRIGLQAQPQAETLAKFCATQQAGTRESFVNCFNDLEAYVMQRKCAARNETPCAAEGWALDQAEAKKGRRYSLTTAPSPTAP